MMALMKSQDLPASLKSDDFEQDVELLSPADQPGSGGPWHRPAMHVLGTAPDTEGTATMLATILMKKTPERPGLEEIAGCVGEKDEPCL